jgi:hypothetical protein
LLQEKQEAEDEEGGQQQQSGGGYAPVRKGSLCSTSSLLLPDPSAPASLLLPAQPSTPSRRPSTQQALTLMRQQLLVQQTHVQHLHEMQSKATDTASTSTGAAAVHKQAFKKHCGRIRRGSGRVVLRRKSSGESEEGGDSASSCSASLSLDTDTCAGGCGCMACIYTL